MAVRKAVFIDELGIDPCLERDQNDSQAVYAIARCNEDIVVIGRMQPDGRIGRVATLSDWRRQGLGRRITRRLIEAARERGLTSVYLAAQVNATPFYAKLGFESSGDVFHAAGIPHQRMIIYLGSHPAPSETSSA